MERLTSQHMTKDEAAKHCPNGKPELRTRELRFVDSQSGESPNLRKG